ncbi:MAG: hypothetical protein ABWJ99_03775 [Caldimicrobium sp.]
MPKELLLRSFEDLLSTAKLFKEALSRYKPYSANKDYSEEEKLFYDALSFRYQKLVEAFLSFLKALELYLFGEASDTLRGRLLRLEKGQFISDMDLYLEARILRNKIVHAYLPDELEELYAEIVNKGKKLLLEIENLEKKREVFL